MSCRLRDPGDLEIVGSGERRHDGKAYRIIYGKPKGGGGSVEQAYRYPVGTWTEAEARSHCADHGGTFHTASKEASASGLILKFLASVQSVGEEQHLVTFYIMNTSLNRNRWRVTDKALTEALPTLRGKPLGCIPGYMVDHIANPLDVGKFLSFEKPDGYALATAEITDPSVWEKVSSGAWGPVSVVITAYLVTCSVCGEEITEHPEDHIHIKNGTGHEVIESFVFDRVDFVSTPAYPQAGVLTLDELAEAGHARTRMASYVGERGEGMSNRSAFAKAPEDAPWNFSQADYTLEQLKRASAYVEPPGDKKEDCHLPHHLPDGTLVWHGVDAAGKVLMGARDGYQGPGKDQAKAHLTPHYHAFDKKAPWESQSNMDGAQGPQGNLKPDEEKEKQKMSEDIAKIQHELEAVKAENETLKTDLDRITEERHAERIETTVEARFKAGLVKDRAAETERLKEFNDATLALLAEDAGKVAERMAEAPRPKAKNTKETRTELEAAVEEKREQLFGHRKEAEK